MNDGRMTSIPPIYKCDSLLYLIETIGLKPSSHLLECFLECLVNLHIYDLCLVHSWNVYKCIHFSMYISYRYFDILKWEIIKCFSHVSQCFWRENQELLPPSFLSLDNNWNTFLICMQYFSQKTSCILYRKRGFYEIPHKIINIEPIC
jgi:hypothetical protein